MGPSLRRNVRRVVGDSETILCCLVAVFVALTRTHPWPLDPIDFDEAPFFHVQLFLLSQLGHYFVAPQYTHANCTKHRSPIFADPSENPFSHNTSHNDILPNHKSRLFAAGHPKSCSSPEQWQRRFLLLLSEACARALITSSPFSSLTCSSASSESSGISESIFFRVSGTRE